MFGKILSVVDEKIVLENLSRKVESTLIGVHVVFESNGNRVVSEIISMSIDTIECIMVGEFLDNKFFSGIIHKPTNDSKVRIINKNEVISLVGNQSISSASDLYFGKSMIYDGFNVSANIDNFFSNHFAIIGNTGSGKSSFVARMFQNLFYRKENIPLNANIVLFDVYTA